MKRSALDDLTEAAVQTQVTEALTWRRVFWWRSQPLPVLIRRASAIVGVRKVPEDLKGMPDIMLVHRGVFVGIELKRVNGGRFSEAQKEWRARIRRSGGIFVLARGWDRVAAVLDHIEATRPAPDVPDGLEWWAAHESEKKP